MVLVSVFFIYFFLEMSFTTGWISSSFGTSKGKKCEMSGAIYRCAICLFSSDFRAFE